MPQIHSIYNLWQLLQKVFSSCPSYLPGDNLLIRQALLNC